jgi:hypothetical protein
MMRAGERLRIETVEDDEVAAAVIKMVDKDGPIPREISSRSDDDSRNKHHSPAGTGRFQPDEAR